MTGPDGPSPIGPALRRLLALLAVRAGSVVTADQISDALGLGSTGAVRMAMSRLRRVVGDVVTAVPPGYVLDPCCLDVRRFEDLLRGASGAEPQDRINVLGEALGLWRGAALVEFADEDWARGESARLDELHLNAAEDRIDALLALGRPAEAAADTQALIGEQPLRERSRGLHMRALAGQGRTAEALRAYQDFREYLGEQAGLEPSAELAQLERRIVQGDIAALTSVSPDPGATSGPPGNLPRQRIELIGRRCELERLAALVVPGELVTLTGPGGVGKTRLALGAAAAAADAFADGAWLVELAGATAADDVLPVVVRRLGLFVTSSPVSDEAIARALGTQQRLVVLDNCEHVIDAVRAMVDAVMGHCPKVAIVATSREALGCEGERVFEVPTLSLEARVGPSDAEQLFRDRVMTGLDGLGADAAVREICAQLDGLPLAIELAAARVGPLGLDEVKARIAGRHDALGRRRGIERHHSLDTVVAWSYDLLSPEEQRVFERLAVFADGFDLAAAEALCGDAPVTGPVEDHLVSLIDKSLVTVQRSTPVRYRLLEVIRQHAESRLSARGESEQMAHRLLAYYVEWVTRADAGARGPDELYWHHRFQAEWNNLRAALNRAVVNGDLDAACTVVWRASWWARERLHLELEEWADAVLAMPGAASHPLIPIVGAASAKLAYERFDWTKGGQRLREAEEREKALGEAPEPWVAHSRVQPEQSVPDTETQPSAAEIRRRGGGSPFWEAIASHADALLPSGLLGNTPGTEPLDEGHLRRVLQCVAAAEALGNPTCTAKAADILGCALRQADPARAKAILETGIATARSVGSTRVEAVNGFDLAQVYAELGRHHDVVAMQRQALRRHLRVGARFYPSTTAAFGSFRTLVALGEHRAACLLLGHSRAHPVTPVMRESAFPTRLEAQLEAELPADEMARLVEEGGQRTVEALVHEVLQALDSVHQRLVDELLEL